METRRKRIVVVGGGAAGFFAAIRCAEVHPSAEVTLYEASAHPLAKVRVSGGGRCNVTHACFEPREFADRYPRGARELLGPLHHFGARETVAWFSARGVALKTESDGRMFPTSDDSQTIIDCLLGAAAWAGVRVVTRNGVRSAARVAAGGFTLVLHDGTSVVADRLLLATGGNRDSAGIAIARAFGHAIEPQVPSLFTFNIDDARLRELAGVSVPAAVAGVRGTKLRETGAVLITHWGLSGPAILRLSAWGARELHAANYRVVLSLNWPGNAASEVFAMLAAERTTHPRRHVASANSLGLPTRLWGRLVAAAGIGPEVVWAALPNAALEALVAQLTASEFAVTGKSINKEEFVTCGGVRLREVDFRTMESRVCPGLFFGGEILDIDGVTGGFNFQSAWTTGWLAGTALVASP